MNTFKKEERLCNKKLIDELFHTGSSFLCYPFKVSWMPLTGPGVPLVQILLSVSKKRYKRAVDRNLLKRRMRESYRINKGPLLIEPLTNCQKCIVFSLGYIGKEIAEYDFIEKKIKKALFQLFEQAAK
jgi:ribonuclease P protein component